MNKQIVKAMINEPSGTGLLNNLRELIIVGRQKALRSVDVVQVQTCWELGRHIVEFEQGGAGRAEYGIPITGLSNLKGLRYDFFMALTRTSLL